MYENFILQQFENGKLEGYSWNVDDPEKVICIVHGIGEYGGRFDRGRGASARKTWRFWLLICVGTENLLEKEVTVHRERMC